MIPEFTPLAQLLNDPWTGLESPVATFTGSCPLTGESLGIQRTVLAERAARQLMSELPRNGEDKMFGVLLAREPGGVIGFLKAFSGKLEGSFHCPGWVPPMLELEPTPLEHSTKARLAELKTRLKELASNPVYRDRDKITAEWTRQAESLARKHLQNKKERDQKRLQGVVEAELAAESRRDSAEKRAFKERRKAAFRPLSRLEASIRSLRKERRELSRALQAELHARFEAELWNDKPWSLASLFPSGPPTGTGECCAPKLLHFAASHALKPLALAEFWWGASTDSRVRGEFYPPCEERCMPLLGPLLSTAALKISILYQDPHLVVVSKPGGLLTVPGREAWNQDCLVGRLSGRWGALFPVHRLDMETSGLVVLAKNSEVLGRLQRQFAERRVEKTYEALLVGLPRKRSGQIDEPIGRQLGGRYAVAADGQPAITRFMVLNDEERRIELRPVTGRSHQLRVHCSQVLGTPILGDALYGQAESHRLMLHAKALVFEHPVSGETVEIVDSVPF